MGGSEGTDTRPEMISGTRLKPRAFSDIREAYEWYEAQSNGLGGLFLRAVDESMDRIVEHPESYPTVIENVRKVMMPRFPYGLFYMVEEDTVVVLACYHASRDPKGWRDLI